MKHSNMKSSFIVFIIFSFSIILFPLSFALLSKCSILPHLQEWLFSYLSKRAIVSTILIMDPSQKMENTNFVMNLYHITTNHGSSFSTLDLNPHLIRNLPHSNNLFIVIETPGLLQFLNKISSNALTKNHWLILNQDIPLINFTYISGISLYSQLFVLEPNSGVYEIYRKNNNLPRVINQIYDQNLRPTKNFVYHLIERRKNLSGVTINVGYFNHEIFDPIRQSGFFYELFFMIAHNFNLRINYINCPDNIYGIRLNGSVYNGILGMIQRGEVDISPMDFTKISARTKDFDFSTFLLKTKLMLFMQNKKFSEFQWYSILHVFDWQFWISILCLSLVFTLVVFFIRRAIQRTSEIPIVFPSFLMVFFTLLGQEPSPCINKITSLRLLILNISLFGALISWIFNGSLISVFTSVKSSLPVQSLNDLVTHSDYRLIIANGTAVTDWFTNTENETDPSVLDRYRMVYQKIIEGNEEKVFFPFDKIPEILATNKKYVYLGEEFTMLTQTKDYPCRLQASSLDLGRLDLGWIYKRNFEYREFFEYQLKKLKETGMIDREWKLLQIKVKSRLCHYKNKNNDFMPIIIQQIVLIFIILGIGILLALIILLFECKIW
ncbi:glutamate receptor U1 [Lepeophtheirus salmonis]|nr:glutamate receptor ionotropic, delta-1-like [Lepeophtheirus salmonis]